MILVSQAQMAADTLRLSPFRLLPAGAVERQHRRQCELLREMVDDLDRRLPVVVEEAAVRAQHAELQRESPAMVGTAARGDERQIGRCQAPIPRQIVFARVVRRCHQPPR